MSDWNIGGGGEFKDGKKSHTNFSILSFCVVFFWTVNTTTYQSQSRSSDNDQLPVRRCRKSGNKSKMFNLYSSMNRRGGGEVEEKKEIQTTGHDRFYQHERSR